MARPGGDGVEFLVPTVPTEPGGRDAQREPVPDGPDDLLDAGGRRFLPRRPATAAVAAACLLAGTLLGYAAARHDTAARPRVAPPPPAAATPAPAHVGGARQAVVQTSGQCALHSGRTVQVGVQVVNSSAEPVTLLRVHVDLPLPGLQAIAQAWGPCGYVPNAGRRAGYEVASGANAWLTVTFRVLADCPGPQPVVFTVDYMPTGQPVIVGTQAFADLAAAPSPRCTPGP